jgi:hypothetical protein
VKEGGNKYMNNMMKLALIAIFGITVLCAGGVKKVEAFQLKIDGAIVADDNVFGDSDPTIGIINYSGSSGVFSTVNAIAFSKDAVGNAERPEFHLNLVGFSSLAGTLSAEISDNFFTGIGNGYEFGFGGFLTPHGTPSTSLAAWLDNSNGLFGHGTPLGSLNDFDSMSTSIIASASPYSISMLTTITHADSTDFQVSSLDAGLVVATPEPGTIALLGIGLAGLVGVGVSRKMKGKAVEKS